MRPIQNPVRGMLHGSAALAALAGLVVLASRTRGNPKAFLAAVVFGLALVAMFTVSTLYHTVPWAPRWKRRWQRIDHAMIYLVVAGTFTPIATASLDAASLAIALFLVWGMAVFGVLQKMLSRRVGIALSVSLQIAMGWIALAWLPQIVTSLGMEAVSLIVAGGVFYMVGVAIFASRRPRLYPPTFSHHELFHVLVIAGGFSHFLVVLLYALPAMV